MQIGLMISIAEGATGTGRQFPPWSEIRAMAQTAEAIGVDTVWFPDHLLFQADPPNVIIPAGERRGVWESWTLLSALAEATRRVTFGPFVACTGFRNPALLAKMADTIDEVSGGRFLLGLGAGWHQPEHDAFGYPFDHRVSRFEEALNIIAPLLREGRVDFQGRYYTARDCELRPRGPRPQGPPIWIGGSRPRMMGLIARWADAYNTDFLPGAAEAADLYARLGAACADAGRDPKTILHTSAVRIAFLDRQETDQPEVRTFDVRGWKRTAVTGTAEQLVELLRTFETAGTQHLTCNVTDPFGVGGIERFGRVLEALRG